MEHLLLPLPVPVLLTYANVPGPGALKVVIAAISRGSNNNDTHGLTSGTIAFPERKGGIAESSENPRGTSPRR